MIAIDWGTSSLRAYRLDDDGRVLDQRHAALGLLHCHGRFAEVLAQQIDGCADPLVLMAGMVGSRNGWVEVPYLPCPADAAALAGAMVDVSAQAAAGGVVGRQVLIAPGMSHQPPGGAPDVMRGEETQLVGLLAALSAADGPGPHRVCLPGTHSKWVTLDGGRITDLATAMTGEVYALMRRHSLLAALMPALDAAEGDADDAAAFARGVQASAGGGGLLHQLFGVRALGLFGQLAGAAAPSYLSGLLIGHELRAMLPAGAGTVHLVGAASLTLRYQRALALLGVACRTHGEALAAAGLHRLALARDAAR